MTSRVSPSLSPTSLFFLFSRLKFAASPLRPTVGPLSHLSCKKRQRSKNAGVSSEAVMGNLFPRRSQLTVRVRLCYVTGDYVMLALRRLLPSLSFFLNRVRLGRGDRRRPKLKLATSPAETHKKPLLGRRTTPH